jgi:hypothetical protein
VDGAAIAGLAFALALGWVLWGVLVRRIGWRGPSDPAAAGLGMLVVLLAVACLAWIGNPYAALLAIPACHLWLPIADPELRPRRGFAISLLVLGLLPLVLLVSFYARQLALGPGELLWMTVLLLAGGHVGVLATFLWSLALGSGVAAALLCARRVKRTSKRLSREPLDVTIRGPLSYAGPGSLGGTPSALRR